MMGYIMMKNLEYYQSVRSLFAREVALLGEQIGQAIDHCRNGEEQAILEDALQSLVCVKSTLEKAIT